jgi:hypothetical protein
MTHKNCPKPNIDKDSHFCYCCGESLFGTGKKYEKDNTLHFPKGVFKACRKAKWGNKKLEMLDENGNVIKNKDECTIL